LNLAYVDTSCLVAVAFDEPGAQELALQLEGYDRLVASNLLEAELRSALTRENVTDDGTLLLSWISWIYPNRPLSPEYERVLAYGYLRGADLWHLACALFLSRDPQQLAFVTLDQRQGEMAASLGFRRGVRGR
jgi:predicted nucleic acid-binding protein